MLRQSEQFAVLFTDKLVPSVLSRFSEQADAQVAAAKNRVVLNVARSLLLVRISKNCRASVGNETLRWRE
jgi:hypothetical protein